MNIPLIHPVHSYDTVVVSIEGCNGAGKTTLLNMYKTEHPDTECLLCVPNIFQKAKEMKHFMLFESSPLCSALYYLGGAVEIFRKHNLSKQKVLLDRSIWSTFAAGYAKDESIIPTLFNCLLAIKNDVFLPNLIVVLDASYEVCQQRISKKREGAEFDKDKIRSFNAKRKFYRFLYDSGYPVVFLNVNSLTPEEVYCEFIKILKTKHIVNE